MVQSEDVRGPFVDRLKQAAQQKGIPEWGLGARLAAIAGTTAKAASKWLNQESMPGRANLEAIASALSVRAEWLQYGIGAPQANGAEEHRGSYTFADAIDSNVQGEPLEVRAGSVPVVGKAMLGPDGYFEALEYPVGHGEGFLSIFSNDPNAYGLRVVGHSMKPRIKHNEFVVVEPNKEYVSGDEVLVKTKGGQCMIKEFVYFRDGQYRFDSVNAAYDPIFLAEHEIQYIQYVGAIVKTSRFTQSE